MITKWLPLTADERARALAETSGRRGGDTETMIVNDDDAPGFVRLSTTKGADAAAVLRRGVGTEISRTFYDGQPHEWAIRIPAKQFRGWGGAFRVQPSHRKPGRNPWRRGGDVVPEAGDLGGEE